MKRTLATVLVMMANADLPSLLRAGSHFSVSTKS